MNKKMSDNRPKTSVKRAQNRQEMGQKMSNNVSEIKSPKILVNGFQNVRNWFQNGRKSVFKCEKIDP